MLQMSDVCHRWLMKLGWKVFWKALGEEWSCRSRVLLWCWGLMCDLTHQTFHNSYRTQQVANKDRGLAFNLCVCASVCACVCVCLRSWDRERQGKRGTVSGWEILQHAAQICVMPDLNPIPALTLKPGSHSYTAFWGPTKMCSLYQIVPILLSECRLWYSKNNTHL